MNRTKLSDSELAALAARIQRDYDYDNRSGMLINAKTNRMVRGKVNCKRNGKYRYLYMHFRDSGKDYAIQMHKIIWAWHHGRFPTMQLDHINGNGFDNHIENLREVSGSENKMNMIFPWKPNAKTGLPGVHKNGSGFRIKVASNRYHFRDRYLAFYHLTLLGRRFK